MPRSTEKYWASKSGLDLAEEADRRVDAYYSGLQNSVMYKRWSLGYRVFYGLAGEGDPFDISKAGIAGDAGQLTSIKVNHAGNLARHSVAIISQTVPDFEPIPTNADFESLEQADWTKRVLAYYMDTRGVGATLYEAAEAAAIFGMSMQVPEWDPLAGADLKAPIQLPGGSFRKKTGDLIFNVFTPLDVIHNRFRHNQDHDWFITRRFVNRYNLAARYPAQADAILDFASPNRFCAMPSTNRLETEREESRKDIWNDDVPLYTLFHRKADAMPSGKYASFLGKDIMLYEGNLPYEDVPAVIICPGKIIRSVYGESGLHHVTGMQETYDNVASSITTNNVAAGTQIICVPEETEYTIDRVLEGLAILKYKAGPEGKLLPTALNLTAPNAEGLNYLKLIRSEMETIYGVPSTMRGAPQPNVQSGSFGALISQQALTYLNAFQYSFQQGVGKCGDLIVSHLKQFADQEILVEIVGKDRAYEVQGLTKDKFSNIHRVTVKSGNPAARTPEFNQMIAEKLLDRNVIKDAKDFIQLIRTGDLDTMVDQQESELMNIRRENAQLAQGISPPAILTDDHKLHILRNKAPLDSPAGRGNDKVKAAVTAHLLEHIGLLRQTDPALLMLLGQTPLPPAPGGSPTPTGTPAAPPAPGGVPGAQPGPVPVPPPPGPARLPEQPNLPVNPATGHPWTPHDGALPLPPR